MSALDYREIVKAFIQNVRSAPATYSIMELINAIYRYYPEFRPVSELNSMIVGSNTGDPDYIQGFVVGATGENASVVWDSRHLAYGIIIDVLNNFTTEGNTVLPKEYILEIIKKMCPAHVPVFLNYK
jgi:hypothetical protein